MVVPIQKIKQANYKLSSTNMTSFAVRISLLLATLSLASYMRVASAAASLVPITLVLGDDHKECAPTALDDEP